MSFSVTVHHGPFLLIVALGDGMIRDVLGMIDLAARVAQMQDYRRVLFDSTSVRFHLSEEEAELSGKHVAAALFGMEKVASVVRVRSVGKVGEKAARAGGLQIGTFMELKAATDWIAE